MVYNFLKLTKQEYINSLSPTLFKSSLGEKCFGVISDGVNEYKFSWQSDSVEPIISEIREGVIAIGIDLNFSIIEFKKQQIAVSIEFDSFFIDLVINGGCIYVISEMKIVKIDSQTLEIINHYDLPDIFEDITFGSDEIIVQCMGEQSITI